MIVLLLTKPVFSVVTRFALILSKTITWDADLSAVYVRRIKDEPCMVIPSSPILVFASGITFFFIVTFQDRHGNVVHKDQEPLIHTDGTGLVSVDLALNCPTSIFKGKFLKPQVRFLLTPYTLNE